MHDNLLERNVFSTPVPVRSEKRALRAVVDQQVLSRLTRRSTEGARLIKSALKVGSLLLLVVNTLALGCSTRPTPTPTNGPALKTFAEPDFGVSLKYPDDWAPSPTTPRRFQGADGYFQLELGSGNGADLDAV
jgi:hypothetical protein